MCVQHVWNSLSFFLCTYLLQWDTENTDSFLKSWQDGLHGLSHISRDYTSLEQRSEIPHSSIPETGFDWSFLSKLWCLLSISSIFVTVSQAELVFSSPLPSRAAGSHQGSPGNAGQPLIPECCFTTHGTVSRRRPSSTLLPTLTSGWRAQMVARSVRLLLSAWSRSCYLTLNVATSLKW